MGRRRGKTALGTGNGARSLGWQRMMALLEVTGDEDGGALGQREGCVAPRGDGDEDGGANSQQGQRQWWCSTATKSGGR